LAIKAKISWNSYSWGGKKNAMPSKFVVLMYNTLISTLPLKKNMSNTWLQLNVQLGITRSYLEELQCHSTLYFDTTVCNMSTNWCMSNIHGMTE
jgi:hypothetical protein